MARPHTCCRVFVYRRVLPDPAIYMYVGLFSKPESHPPAQKKLAVLAHPAHGGATRSPVSSFHRCLKGGPTMDPDASPQLGSTGETWPGDATGTAEATHK